MLEVSLRSPIQDYQFNVTWQDNYNVHTVLIEHNFSGTFENYSTIKNNNEYYYNFGPLAAGTYAWKSYANDSTPSWNTTDEWCFSIGKGDTTID